MKIFSATWSLFVGNLDFRVTENDLVELFNQLPLFKRHLDKESVKVVHKYDYSYAFINLELPEAVRKALALKGQKSSDIKILELYGALKAEESLSLYERKMCFSLMKNHKNTDDLPNYEGPDPVPSEPFDLQPSESNLPCIHVLFDSVLLHIFKYMKLGDLFISKNVCKRFNNLANIALIDKLRKYNDGCFKTWLLKNGLSDTFESAIKILRIGGHILTKIEICSEFKSLEQSIYLISEYCQNLEELYINSLSFISPNYMSRLGEKCTKLKKLCIKGKIYINDRILHSIFTKNRKLEIFQLNTAAEITRKCFIGVPNTLKEFSCFGQITDCKNRRMSPWRRLFVTCKKLEVLNVNGIMPPYILKDAVKFCPNMKELMIKFGTADQFEWSLFPKLKKLNITARNIYLNHFSSNEFLEELIINKSSENIEHQWTQFHGDFTSLKNLKRFTDDTYSGINNEILRSIDSCTNLEYLELSIAILDPVIHCIEKLPLLKELICKDVTIGADDIQRLVNARHRSATKLKLTIGIDESALLQIERLQEANYEVSVFDAFNLFMDIEEALLPDDEMIDFEV